MKILSFTHPNVIPNLYDFLSSVEHKIKYFKSLYLLFLDTSDFQCMEKNKIPQNIFFNQEGGKIFIFGRNKKS